MSPFEHIHYTAKSDPGLVRTNNEDAYGVFPEFGVYCVADGMGGGDDGEYASSETVAVVSDYCDLIRTSDSAVHPASVLIMGISEALDRASARIVRHTLEKGLKVCGSTFVGIVFDATAPDIAVALHAGDSRLYRYRDGSLKQMTRDHSVAELIGVKDERELDKRLSSVIVRAVGVQTRVELEKTPIDVLSGDRFFLCSDGLSRMVPEETLSKIITENSSADSIVDKMIESAKIGGGVDNITVVFIDVGELPASLLAMGQSNASANEERANDFGNGTVLCESTEHMPIHAARPPARRSPISVMVLGLLFLIVFGGLWLARYSMQQTALENRTVTAQLVAACDSEIIRRFVHVVRLLDRHGVPDGFEGRAHRFIGSPSPESAAELARDVLTSVKAGVDYARDCAELNESVKDRRTERLRKSFIALSSELDGAPDDPATQARCAAIIVKVAGWD